MAFSLETALQAISDRFTPEMRAEMQERSKERIGRIDPGSPAMRVKRLQSLKSSWLDQIDYLEHEPDSDLKTIRMTNALDRLGEILASLGDYAGAISVTQSQKRLDLYKRINAAIDRPFNQPLCNCPVTRAKEGRGHVVLDPRFKLKTIRTPEGQRSLMICATCGEMYAT